MGFGKRAVHPYQIFSGSTPPTPRGSLHGTETRDKYLGVRELRHEEIRAFHYLT